MTNKTDVQLVNELLECLFSPLPQNIAEPYKAIIAFAIVKDKAHELGFYRNGAINHLAEPSPQPKATEFTVDEIREAIGKLTPKERLALATHHEDYELENEVHEIEDDEEEFNRCCGPCRHGRN